MNAPRIAGALLLAALAACARSRAASGPPTVRWGEDACDECHMILSDPRDASVARLADGTELRFDDVGDAAAWFARHPAPGAAVWAHDWETDRWIPAASARFVVSPRFATPMGHGVVAVADAARANALARENAGQISDWSGLVAAARGALPRP